MMYENQTILVAEIGFDTAKKRREAASGKFDTTSSNGRERTAQSLRLTSQNKTTQLVSKFEPIEVSRRSIP